MEAADRERLKGLLGLKRGRSDRTDDGDLEERRDALVPLFAFLFGIREWELDLLSHEGFLRYEEFAHAWLDAQKEAARG